MKKKTKEDYLSTIYRIQEENNKEISSIQIAKKLKIAKSSVSEMVKKLKKENLVQAEHYGKIKLTSNGLKQAKTIIHNHRLIEYFLKKVLKCNRVHKEAHDLEHSLSQSTIKKLDNFLGNPRISPTGKKIH